ncbi:hypothetical protein PRABACTJOHN_00826 [Parabacteroides johnsonii DSM 18315]|uniref:Sporulation integral membrane protein YtvI n=1 Tax=Parabacteroides johnsonii DSM 18315 TaxID=537006 RepID=B7B729_9BACT|nr:hypothetical protein PRABACTJOHN_00826 [Parabacteroides johnsonii DSM 18315]
MNPLFDKPFTFDRVARILFGLAVISGVIYLIAVLRNALLPFLIAWLLAYMMQPFVKFFQYKVKLKSRLLSILAVLVSTLLVISLVGVVIVPSVTQEVNRTLELMQEHNRGYGHIPMIPQSWAEYLEKNIDPDQLAQLLSKENIEKAVKQIAPKMWIVLTNTFSILFSITIVFVIFLYFILYPAGLRTDCQRLDPPDPRTLPSFCPRAGRRCRIQHEPLFPRTVVDCFMRRYPLRHRI